MCTHTVNINFLLTECEVSIGAKNNLGPVFPGAIQAS